MPIYMDKSSDIEKIELHELIEYIDGRYKTITLDNLIDIAPVFNKLNNNSDFLARFICNELKNFKNFQENNIYTSQSLHLGGVENKFYIRANIWLPRQSLHEVNFEGEASLYAYGLPHDHNFSFITSGFYGTGYRSELYEYDNSKIKGFQGEYVDLKSKGTTWLTKGDIMVYRESRDVHIQDFPEELSISLNLIPYPNIDMNDQYIFDIKTSTISSIFRSQSRGKAFLLEAAMNLCNENIKDIIYSKHKSMLRQTKNSDRMKKLIDNYLKQ
ncbi:TPA: hypothetical protein ACX3CA_003520 [Vibrio parahaemolyticus]